jgi:hypothetical protein
MKFEIPRFAQNDKNYLRSVTVLRQALRLPGLATDAVAPQDAGSENIEPPHQFLARFHRLPWIHPAEHFFPAFTIHCC